MVEKPEKASGDEFGITEDMEDAKKEPTMAVALDTGDEEDVIDNINKNYAKEATNAMGEPTGEKILFKEDAQKAGAEVITTLRGIKGSKLS